MSRRDDLLQYLQGKRCAMSRSRMLEDLRWPAPELEAALGLLMREHRIRAPRPGEYEVTPEPLPGHEQIAQVPHETRAMATVVVHRPTKEIDMAKGKKTCTKCDTEKGLTGFPKGSDVCRLCTKGKVPKEPRPITAPKHVNGKTVAEIAAKHAPPAKPSGFRISKGDVTVFCDTAADAAQLVQALGA